MNNDILESMKNPGCTSKCMAYISTKISQLCSCSSNDKNTKQKSWTGNLKILFKKFLKPIFKSYMITYDIVADALTFYVVHLIAINVHGIYFVSGLTYASLITIVVAHSLIGFFIAHNYENIFHAKLHGCWRFLLFLFAPIVAPCIIMTKLNILHYEANLIIENWQDDQEDAHGTPTEVFREYLVKQGHHLDLKKVYITMKQILMNIENIPQLILVIAFMLVDDIHKLHGVGIQFNILPTGGLIDNAQFWVFFTFNWLTSLYSAMSSFIASTTLVKGPGVSCISKYDLYMSFYCQLTSRIIPVIGVCIIAIESEFWESRYSTGPEWEISLWIIMALIFFPLFIRYCGIYLVYNWNKLSSKETRKLFQDLGYLDKRLHMMTNTFVVNPLSTKNKYQKPDFSELNFLSCLCLLDSMFYLTIWLSYFIATKKSPELHIHLAVITFAPIFLALPGLWGQRRYYKTFTWTDFSDQSSQVLDTQSHADDSRQPRVIHAERQRQNMTSSGDEIETKPTHSYGDQHTQNRSSREENGDNVCQVDVETSENMGRQRKMHGQRTKGKQHHARQNDMQ